MIETPPVRHAPEGYNHRMSASPSYDIAIIGAGAAGLAAARTACDAGLRVIVLEAKNRLGGRAYTDTVSLGIPFDHGCHWMHSASRNPFVPIAERLGFTILRYPRHRRIVLGDRWATEGEVEDWTDYTERQFLAIENAGRAARDVSAAEVVDSTSRWYGMFRAWCAMMTSVDLEHVSTLDHARYIDTRENWPLREGYGALLVRYAAGLPVMLETPAERVDWHGPAVRIETRRGTVEASAVILTVSTSVLAAGRPRFEPPLPAWKRDAIDALPLGAANKVAFRFDGDVFGPPNGHYAMFAAPTAATMSFQIRTIGPDTAVGYVGGRACIELEQAGPAACTDFALGQLKGAFGSSIERRVVASVCTAWHGDPDIRGGYSAARPGYAHRRADLALPVEDRLFFAGEAASTEFYSTAHGAYLTGVAAAERAMAVVTGRAPVPAVE